MPRALAVIPADVSGLTPGWLTARLGSDGAFVTGAEATGIGADQGFTGGRLYRVAMAWEGEGPASVVAKLSPADPAMRKLMRQANAAEVQFYRSLAPLTALPVPRSYDAAAAPTGESVLLMEDLGSHRRVDLHAGCSPCDAGAVVTTLAEIHAAWWNRPEVAALGGASLLAQSGFEACWPRYPARLAQVLPDVELPGWFVALADRMARHRASMAVRLFESGPMTLLHRDCHVENVLFAPGGRAVLLDWQFMGRGRGAFDLGYFLISSLAPDQRRATERDLVARYHAGLVRGGVTGYSLGACWQDYLWSVAGKFWLTVAATVAYDNAGAWKAQYRRQDLLRLIAFCADHGISDTAFLPGAA